MAAKDYSLCGWRVRSQLALPNLPLWDGDERMPDVTITLGGVPEWLENPVFVQPLLQMDHTGNCRYAIDGVAAYLVDGEGRHVVVDPAMAPDAADIRIFLFGTLLAILCFRRGLFPLHASCVRIGRVAVAFTAPSGTGKSTLAAALLRQGHALVADDVTVIDAAAPGGPVVWGSVPMLKLTPDIAARLGFDACEAERPFRKLDKHHLRVPDFIADSLPLAAIYHLGTVKDSHFEKIEALTGMSAITKLHRAQYRPRLATIMGVTPTLFGIAGRLASGPVAQFCFDRRQDIESLDTVAATIAARHGAKE